MSSKNKDVPVSRFVDEDGGLVAAESSEAPAIGDEVVIPAGLKFDEDGVAIIPAGWEYNETSGTFTRVE